MLLVNFLMQSYAGEGFLSIHRLQIEAPISPKSRKDNPGQDFLEFFNTVRAFPQGWFHKKSTVGPSDNASSRREALSAPSNEAFFAE